MGARSLTHLAAARRPDHETVIPDHLPAAPDPDGFGIDPRRLARHPEAVAPLAQHRARQRTPQRAVGPHPVRQPCQFLAFRRSGSPAIMPDDAAKDALHQRERKALQRLAGRMAIAPVIFHQVNRDPPVAGVLQPFDRLGGRPRQRCQPLDLRLVFSQGPPDAHPLEARILVGRVLGPVLPRRLQIAPEHRPPHPEQGPQHRKSGPLPARRDSGKTVGARRPGQPHQHGLGLVVHRMSGKQRLGVMGPAPAAHQVIARPPRPRLDAGQRLLALPAQRLVRKSQRIAPSLHLLRLGRRRLAQGMIDRQHTDLREGGMGAPRLVEQPQQGHGIGAAGDRGRDMVQARQSGEVWRRLRTRSRHASTRPARAYAHRPTSDTRHSPPHRQHRPGRPGPACPATGRASAGCRPRGGFWDRTCSP